MRRINAMLSVRTLLPLLSLLALGCNQAASAEPPQKSPVAVDNKDVVATVNGVNITDRDVRLRAKSAEGHKESKAAAGVNDLNGVLETVIREEAAAQRAKELGLDADPKYQEGLAQLEAQVTAYRRKALSELFWERHVDKQAAPSEDEMRAYFDKNEAKIRTSLHIKQILRKGRAAIDEAKAQIDGGKSFDDVAASTLPNRPPGVTPWDMGYLGFYKVPEAWRSTVYDLAPGQVSPVIAGPNERYWLVVVVDKKVEPSLDFAAVRGQIEADLLRQRLEGNREKAAADLAAKAKITRVRAPTPAAPHPAED
ncbi:MAG: peptidyl-prolyl cis-trans isomerase [Byssovorax sp.]